jgi:hypothetical protein
MADQSNDTQSKINEEDRDIAARPENRTGQDRDSWNQGSSSMPGGADEAEGIFAHDGEGVTGEALGGGPLGTGNTGAELSNGTQSEFARTTGGETDGLTTGTSGSAGSGSGGAGGQSVGSVGTIGGTGGTESSGMASHTSGAAVSVPRSGRSETGNEYGAQHSTEPAGADHQHSALGGSVTAASGNSDSPGPDQTGRDHSAFTSSQPNERAEGSARKPVPHDSDANDSGDSSSF